LAAVFFQGELAVERECDLIGLESSGLVPVTVHSIGSASPLVAQGDIKPTVDLARNNVADLLRFINFGTHHGNQPELLADD
jgi:hypothetical protein